MAVRNPFDKPSINDLISKGARVKEDMKPKGLHCFINLRVGSDMLNDIDMIMKSRVGISRTGWILEAIQEKIKRDSQS